MWIRTQDRNTLVKVERVALVFSISVGSERVRIEGQGTCFGKVDLGTYKNKEEAVSVLDQLESWVCTTKDTSVFDMQKEIYDENKS